MATPLTSLAPGARPDMAQPGSVTSQGNVAWSKSSDGAKASGEASWYKSGDCPPHEKHHHHHDGRRGTNWAWVIIVFIIVVVIIWLLLFAFKPEFVQKKNKHGQPTGEVDNGLAILWAIIIAIIICIIVWVIKLAAYY